MTTNRQQHLAHPWRVHTLAPDFRLLDVWHFDVDADHRDLDPFLAALLAAMHAGASSRLARLRLWLGKKLHWDDHPHTLPIPGCTETTLASRLTDADRAANRSRIGRAPIFPEAGAVEIYRFADEALFEVSNDTIHALLHVGMVGDHAVLAVYIKSRGFWSRAYMATIAPFRHLFVYPALTRSVERRTTSSAS
jgi:uncharacterized protein DUF2867